MSEKPTIEQLLDACEKPNCCACGWPWDAKAMVCGGCGFEPLAELSALRERLAAAERERDEALADQENIREILAATTASRREWVTRATRAEADGAAMRQLLEDAHPYTSSTTADICDDDLADRISAALASDHPGAALLARATAAEAVVEAARKLRKVDQDIRVGSAGMMNAREAALALDAALAEVAALERYQAAIASGLSHAEAQEEGWPATYDARVQECAGDSETGRLNKEE